jgi:hypothetical protein
MGAQLRHALSLGDLTNAEASSGLKTALEKGALSSISLLGLGCRIWTSAAKSSHSFAKAWKRCVKTAVTLDRGRRLTELVMAISRAAESAVPMGGRLSGRRAFYECQRCQNILTGAGFSVTSFFAEKTRTPLGVKFLPINQPGDEKSRSARSTATLPEGVASSPCEGRRQHQRYVTGRTRLTACTL